MYPPVDYPVQDENTSTAVVAQMTYATLLERFEAEEPITEDMIQSASRSMESAQHQPCATKPRKRADTPPNPQGLKHFIRTIW